MKNHLLPETGFVRLSTILKIIPIGKSSWWDGVKKGKFPQSVKLGTRTTAWRVEDIRNLIDNGLRDEE
jgi:predicted DNA-binding transcriptional regulator AlpA